MRIACVDLHPAARSNLKIFIDSLFESCRDAVGHITMANAYTSGKEELMVNSLPDVAVFQPNEDTLDNSLFLLRELSKLIPALPLIVFLEPELFTFRNLKRFEPYTTEIFSTEENSLRVIHKLSRFQTSASENRHGLLIPVVGAKGGIGATSITAALAHAAQSLGKSSVVIDLSPLASLLHYLATPRWNSSEYTSILSDNRHPDPTTVEHLLTIAPNKITALLPPTGGVEIRDFWLRDADRFELTLAIVEELQRRYDLVLVDIANVEGILPYALISRSDSTLIITSNDPASVHLLNSRLTQIAEIPGSFAIKILFNMMHKQGLNHEDIIDFLYANANFHESMTTLPDLAFDARGSRWMGTSNTFYTESCARTQATLENILHQTCGYVTKENNGQVKTWLPKLLGYSKTTAPKKTPAAIPYFGALNSGRPLAAGITISRPNEQQETLQPVSLSARRNPAESSAIHSNSELFELPETLGARK
ncbi:MAG: ParA family protein [Deltaproteobacteria bacterium]|nr:ParA family protein [Deltaproteobacteria bacterium]